MQRRPEAGKSGDGPQTLSVVVPAYAETENIRPLCERLFAALELAKITGELIIVDDESSGTAETIKVVEALAGEGYRVRVHSRKTTEGRGLSSAVLLGFKLAKHPVLLCMDADLQHEPESVPDVARPVLLGEAEFSVGSRNVSGGGVGFDWSLKRRITSSGATMLAWPVAKSTDPMSGFFCTRRDVLNRAVDRLNPIGFKIGLEIMVRCRCKTVLDVAITFQERQFGESKLSPSQYVKYVQQLVSLYWDKFFFLIVLFFLFMIAPIGFVAQRAIL